MSTTEGALKRTQTLKESRRKDSERKRTKVVEAIEAMSRDGQRITVAGIARKAGVSAWLIYNVEELRALADKAVEGSQQATAEADREGRVRPGSTTDLAVALAKVRELTQQNEKLRSRVQMSLGAELDQAGAAEYVERISRLEAEVGSLNRERTDLAEQVRTLQRKVEDAHEEVEAVRAINRELIAANK